MSYFNEKLINAPSMISESAITNAVGKNKLLSDLKGTSEKEEEKEDASGSVGQSKGGVDYPRGSVA
jgi:hypothetical protein